MARWGKSCTYLAPILTLSQNEPKWDSTWPMSPRSSIMNQASTWASSLRITIECVQKDFWALWYVWRRPCTYLGLTLTLSPNGLKQDPHDPCHLGIQSGASKTISEPVVRSAQTMHLSYTVSKQTKSTFDLSIITLEYHWMSLKRFLTLRYVWRKSYTYLGLTPTLSPNGPKQDSTRPTSLSSSIGSIQNDFWAYGTFGANHACILRQD
jgi:hypothetical protein